MNNKRDMGILKQSINFYCNVMNEERFCEKKCNNCIKDIFKLTNEEIKELGL